MGPHSPSVAEDQLKVKAGRFLTVANYFLRNRNFADCRKFALRARNADPTNPEPTRLLSTVSVLSVPKILDERHDYYAVLDLSQFESDPSRIGSSFETLKSILNPKVNLCQLVTEAFDLVLKAWSVLSNPSEKSKFDDELRRISGIGASSSNPLEKAKFDDELRGISGNGASSNPLEKAKFGDELRGIAGNGASSNPFEKAKFGDELRGISGNGASSNPFEKAKFGDELRGISGNGASSNPFEKPKFGDELRGILGTGASSNPFGKAKFGNELKGFSGSCASSSPFEKAKFVDELRRISGRGASSNPFEKAKFGDKLRGISGSGASSNTFEKAKFGDELRGISGSGASSNPLEKAKFGDELRGISGSGASSNPFEKAKFGNELKGISDSGASSNYLEKAKFGDERMGVSGGRASSNPFGKAKVRVISGSGGDDEVRGISSSGTFWTVCPYCYYAYEYDRAYVDCSLRCMNERCRRVLQAVPFASPPPGVVEKGYFLCPGFMPFSVRTDKGEEIEDNMWIPFPPPGGKIPENQGYDHNCSNFGPVSVVNVENSEDLSNGKKIKLNAKLGTEIKNERKEGRLIHHVCGEGDLDLDLLDPEGAVEFFEGDGDVLVGLQFDFDFDCDLANEEL